MILQRKSVSAPQLACLILLLLVVWLTPPSVAYFATGSWAESGVVGDTFGVANSLIGGLGFLGILYTLKFQISDAQERDAQARRDQRLATDQLYHLALTSRLQSCEARILENRQAVGELRPAFEMPVSDSLTKNVLERLSAEKPGSQVAREKLEETIERVKAICELRREIEQISKQLTQLQQRLETQRGPADG